MWSAKLLTVISLREARKGIKKFLAMNHSQWLRTRADFIKSDTNFNYLSPWHYINLKGGLTHDEVLNILKPDTGVNLYAKMNFLIRELKNKNLEKDKKLMYLRLLVHLAGDLHQPRNRPAGELLGGNRIRVLWFNDSTNLQRVGRSAARIPKAQLYRMDVISHTTKQQRSDWQKTPISEWFTRCTSWHRVYMQKSTGPNQRLSYPVQF